jgi:hypothetical protein
MSNLHHSFRFRLALTFALFGAMVSLLLSIGLSFTAHNLGERLIDETLRAEIEDYMSRRSRNPGSLPPATVSIQGYVFLPGQSKADLPPELHDLIPGKYQLTLNNIPYRIAVADQADERYVMMFNEMRQRHRESTFLIYLVVGALSMTLVSAWTGWWLAGRVVAPIAELGRRVSKASPQDLKQTKSENSRRCLKGTLNACAHLSTENAPLPPISAMNSEPLLPSCLVWSS